jgi:uncharacterized protein (TIGR03545 family)
MAVQYVLGLVVRSAAIHAIADSTQVPVHVGHARVLMSERTVVFEGLHVGALEADRCELKFAAASALHKQLDIESGQIRGIRFGASSRANSEVKRALRDTCVQDWFKPEADQAAKKWLERLNGQLSLDAVKGFASVARTETFCANWSKCSAGLESRLKQMDGRTAELQKSIEAAERNPLRNDKLLVELREKVAGLQKEFSDFSVDVEQLPDVLEKERRAIVAARRRDDQVVGKRLELDPIEENSLSAYLLREEASRQLTRLVSCLRSMRSAVPMETVAEPTASRGETILFAGCKQQPAVVIRSLQLEGATRIAGQPVELHGFLTGYSSAPRLSSEPIRLHLIGYGSLPLEMEATIDRTRAVPRDQLVVDCQGVLLREMALGKAEQLGLSLAPSIGALSVKVAVDGDRLSGNIQLVQQRVQITPILNGAAGKTLTAALDDTLGSVGSIATHLTLSGTVDQPKCDLQSNLGAAVAQAVQRAVRRTGDQHARALLAEAGRRVDERLAEVDRQLAERQAQFAIKSTLITARLQKIATKDEPQHRISVERIGRRLPENSLFR